METESSSRRAKEPNDPLYFAGRAPPVTGAEGWESTRRWTPARRAVRVLAWPGWVVGQVLTLVGAGDLMDATPKRQKLNKAQASSVRARLAPAVLAGPQRDRQPDYFGNVACRATSRLFLPDGLLDVSDRGFRWSPFWSQVRDVAASWDEVAQLVSEPIETERHALTIGLVDGSRIGLLTDEDPARIDGIGQRLADEVVAG